MIVNVDQGILMLQERSYVMLGQQGVGHKYLYSEIVNNSITADYASKVISSNRKQLDKFYLWIWNLHLFSNRHTTCNLQTNQDEANKKMAEVKNVKKLLAATPISPKPVQSEACSPMQPLRTTPLHSLTPSHAVNMFYTECNGCKKLERKLEKLEEHYLRIKMFLQKITSSFLVFLLTFLSLFLSSILPATFTSIRGQPFAFWGGGGGGWVIWCGMNVFSTPSFTINFFLGCACTIFFPRSNLMHEFFCGWMWLEKSYCKGSVKESLNKYIKCYLLKSFWLTFII